MLFQFTVQRRGSTVVKWLTLPPHSKRVLGFEPTGFLCGVYMFSFCLCVFSLGTPASSLSSNTVCVFSLGTLASSHNSNTCRLIGDSKLPIGVNASGCLSLYVGPVTDWTDIPRHPPRDRLQHPQNPVKDKRYR